MTDLHAAFLEALQTEGEALLAAVESARDAPVAACPGWDNLTLAAHVGRIWQYVSRQARSTEPLDPKGAPPDGVDPLSWAREGLAALVTTLGELEPAAPCWNWARDEPNTAAFWFRRMAQETAVHRWDAEAAAGSATPIASWLAADGIDEVMTMWLPKRRGQAKEDVTGTAHLHAADPVPDQPSEWFLELGPAGAVTCRHAHEKGDGVVRGPAHDILLRLWGRPNAAEEFGDSAVLAALHAE
jgi:uncharacterized protein (TIGR03083 family)